MELVHSFFLSCASFCFCFIHLRILCSFFSVPAGKSNLMDAISFVLGVRSQQLRSQQLQDLIFRAPSDDDPRPNKASVRLVYTTGEGDEIHFTRRITAAGGSDYLLNDKVVTFAQYSKTLQKENILVKARNFLVFQGDVESVAAQSPKDLTKLVEQISGSLELKEQYDALKTDMEKANEDLTEKFNKKKSKAAPPVFSFLFIFLFLV